MREVDVRSLGNFGPTPEDTNTGVYVEFLPRQIKNEAKSLAENRPICESLIYIEKHLPGGRDVVSRVATERDFEEYPKAYALFCKKNKGIDEVSGTPLTELSFLSTERVMEYRLMNVFTAEQLSVLPDGAIQKMGPGTRAEREKTKAYLQAAKDGAVVQKQVDEINELRRVMADQQGMISDLQAALRRKELDEDETPKKKGRLKKEEYGESIGSDSARHGA